MSRELRSHQARMVDQLQQALRDGCSEAIVEGQRFRLIPAFPRYMVSEAGEVFSGIRAGRILRQTISPQGYPYVSLMGVTGRPQKMLVHRLVATVFIANPLGLAVVNHRNGVKTDPHVVNLEWVSYAENNDHARATKLSLAFGETHYAAKLSNAAVIEIRKLGSSGLLHREIAAQFGVSRQRITQIINCRCRVGDVR